MRHLHLPKVELWDITEENGRGDRFRNFHFQTLKFTFSPICLRFSLNILNFNFRLNSYLRICQWNAHWQELWMSVYHWKKPKESPGRYPRKLWLLMMRWFPSSKGQGQDQTLSHTSWVHTHSTQGRRWVLLALLFLWVEHGLQNHGTHMPPGTLTAPWAWEGSWRRECLPHNTASLEAQHCGSSKQPGSACFPLGQREWGAGRGGSQNFNIKEIVKWRKVVMALLQDK